LDQLDIILEALTRINTIIVRVTPVGVFAIVASIAGTLTLDELDRLRAYFMIYTAAALILSFWILPMLVAALTPFSYRQVVSVSRDAVMTAFATGKLFVVLPMLIEASNRLFSELPAEDKEKTTSASVLVPLAYPFPSIGKLLGLFFVPFAAWYVGKALPLEEYPALIGAGIVSFFGSPLAAVPFLLDVARVPADMFNLFIVSGVYCARLGDAVGAVHLLTFSVLTTCALTGRLRFRVTRLLGFGLVTVVLLGVSIGTIRMTLSAVARDAVEMEPALNRMRFNGSAVSHSVLEIAERNPDAFVPGESRLQRIQRRGILRVGFDSEALPFAFFNADGELVGFDVELAHQLAVDLGVEIEFVPFRQESLEGQLADDHFDVAMSGIASDFHTINRMHMVESRIDLTPALVVPDHLRDEFSSLDAIRDVGEVRFGFVGDVQFSERFFRRLPDVEVIPLESARTWFDGGDEEIVGLITTAEAGYAWTMLYPSFHVVIPAGARSKEPHAFAIARDDADFAFFLDHWASLNKKTGAIDVLYAHWILGKGAEEYEPRWSVVRDVLGWGTKE
ncbi:MAG: transporter substrate-binding domain-containing protein, partial [bacterium]|nr:transporter substrate-binding domain-containing protein [bacterium]